MIDTANRVHALEVEGIRPHPNADNLTLVKLRDHADELVANKREDGTFRYRPGQLLTLLPVGAILPRWLLEEMEAWKTDPATGKGKGLLAGNQGNRVGSRKFAPLAEGQERYESRGALRPVETSAVPGDGMPSSFVANPDRAGEPSGGVMAVEHGTDVTDFLGIAFR